MFCMFFIYTRSIEIIRSIILDVIVKEKVIRPHDDSDNIRQNNSSQESLNIVFDAFSMSLKMMSEKAIKLKNEMYVTDFNCRINFEIFHSVPDYDHQIMKFIGRIMQRIDSDCAFEDNGDALLFRKSGEIIIDESWSSRLVPFPYEELGLSYSKGTIVLY